MADSIFSSRFFATVRSKAEQYEWARNARDTFARQTEASLAQPIDIPLLGGGWSHNYNCPNEGDRLQRIDRHHHKCPSCGTIWSGSPWDEVTVANDHWRYAIVCRDAAVLYALSGSPEGLEYAKKVLHFYAEHYDAYPLHDKMGGQTKTAGKVQCQTLSEASWLIPLAQACYILKQQGALTDEEQKTLADRLFYPATRVIKTNPAGMSNWQTYHNAAKLWAAAATGDRMLAEEALHDPSNGFYFQMEHSLAEDGFWYEGAWGYHFYTLEAQVMIVLGATCFGIRLQDHPRFQAMFRAPLACMLPDGKLPPVHDSGEVDVSRYAHLYELAYSGWGEGRELVVASPRTSLYSLLFGAPELANEDTASQAQERWIVHDLKRAGMLFVKQRSSLAGAGAAAMIDYGPHDGGHGHRDKLNLLYYAKGHPWLNDAGTLPYGNSMYERYFKQTIAHNTVSIGGRSQQEAEGRLLYAHETAEGFFEFAAAVDTAVPGTMLQRKLILTEDYLVDGYRVTCDGPQTIDWIMHTEGELQADGQLLLEAVPDESLGSADGYSYLRSIRPVHPASNSWCLRWTWKPGASQRDNDDDVLEVYGFPGAEPEQLWTAESPAMPSVGKRHALIRRCVETAEKVFVTVWRACSSSDATPLQITIEDGQLQIVSGDGQKRTFSLDF